jgi:hypothetical protein
MPENYRVVNPTKVISGHELPTRRDPDWKRPVWQGDISPSENTIVSLAQRLDVDGGYFGPADGRWVETKPSDTLIVQQQRSISLGRFSLPLGWRQQYKTTVGEILAV